MVKKLICQTEAPPIKASVSSGIVGGAAPLLDGKQLRSVGPVELLKAVHRNSWSASHKLQQAGPHLVAERQDNSPVPWWTSVTEWKYYTLKIISICENFMTNHGLHLSVPRALPLDDNMVWMVIPLINCVSFPVLKQIILASMRHSDSLRKRYNLDINGSNATHQKLKLSLIENLDKK